MASNLRVDNIQPSTGMGIGIGTANGSVAIIGDLSVDTSKGLTVGAGATISGSTNTIVASTNGSERLRITSTGNVGIGSDDPQAPLNVVNSNSTTPTAWIRNTSGGGDSPALRVQGGANNNNTVGTFEVRDYDGNVDFKVGGTGTVTIGNGNLVFSTSGTGIDFSATSDASGMTSELLDDYEEGTWTPDLRFGGSNTGVSYAWRNGHYTKIGRQVTVRCAFGLTSKGTFTTTARAAIYGLPYDLDPYNISGGFNYSFVGSYSGGVEGIHVIEHQYGSAYVDHFLLSRITAANTSFSEMQYQHVGGTQRIAFVTTYFTTT